MALTDLWSGTFTLPGASQLDRHYSTYSITSDGMLTGMLPATDEVYYAAYRALDEFSSIARQLIVLNVWAEYADLWNDALQSALSEVTSPAQ